MGNVASLNSSDTRWNLEIEVSGVLYQARFSVKELRVVMGDVSHFELVKLDRQRDTLTLRMVASARDPQEALSAASDAWTQAMRLMGVQGASIVRAQVVSLPPADAGGPAGGGTPGPDSAGLARSAWRRLLSPWTIIVLAAVVILTIAVAAIRFFGERPGSQGGRQVPAGSTPQDSSGKASATRNLFSNPSLEEIGEEGLPEGISSWGSIEVAAISDPVVSGSTAIRVSVPSWRDGGTYVEVPATPGTYIQAAHLNVEWLEGDAAVWIVAEWLDGSDGLLATSMFKVRGEKKGFVRLEQQVSAPADTRKGRFLVNLTGGGAYALDDIFVHRVSAGSQKNKN